MHDVHTSCQRLSAGRRRYCADAAAQTLRRRGNQFAKALIPVRLRPSVS